MQTLAAGLSAASAGLNIVSNVAIATGHMHLGAPHSFV